MPVLDVKRQARRLARRYRVATAAARALPDFLVLGAQRAGTPSLYEVLVEHPRILGSARGEVHYFDINYGAGEAWYRSWFPRRSEVRRRQAVVGEASPLYLLDPRIPERAHALLPGARLIAILRDPVERAYAGYQHERAGGRETLSFEEAVAREDERLRGELERMAAEPLYVSEALRTKAYLLRGRYAEQLERWLAVYPRDQLHVVIAEELFAEPERVHAGVCAFLGLPFVRASAYPLSGGASGSMAASVRSWLEAHFAEPNARLAELIGRDPGWR